MNERLTFVIAGAQKAGTTTLDAMFRCHPQVAMANTKETHFFDNEQLNWDVPNYGELDSFYPDPVTEGQLRGEATPITFYWKPAIRRLHKYNPDIKIILLLRNPIDRAFSQWKMEYYKGRDRMLFAEAIRAGRERVQRESERENLHRVFSYIERGLYGEQLSYLDSFFPRKNIHCVISEKFFKDPVSTLSDVSEFLGIERFPAQATGYHLNVEFQSEYPSGLTAADVRYLTQVFREDISKLESLLGRSVPLWRKYHE